MIPRRPLLSFSRARRPRLGVLASAAIAAVVLVIAAAVYALVAGDRFAPVAPPSPTPVGSLPASSSGPSSALKAFVAMVGRADRTFHVQTRTDVTVGDKTVTVVSSLDHAGAAYAGTIDITSPNRTHHEDVVTVLPFTYVRDTDGPWRSGDAPKRSLDPFASLSGATPAADLGLETVDGRSLHHLRLAVLPVDTTFAPEVKSVVYTSTIFDLWVDDAGAPVSGTFVLAGTAIVSEKPVAVSIRATFVFSRVGEPITITAPPRDQTGAADIAPYKPGLGRWWSTLLQRPDPVERRAREARCEHLRVVRQQLAVPFRGADDPAGGHAIWTVVASRDRGERLSLGGLARR